MAFRLGLEIGPGGKPGLWYVLYGEFASKSVKVKGLFHKCFLRVVP